MKKLMLATALVMLCSTLAEGRTYTYCQSLVTGRFITRAQATLARVHSRCVPPLLDEWLVVRWADGFCQVWHNDVSPVGTDWSAPARASSPGEAWAKLQALYARPLASRAQKHQLRLSRLARAHTHYRARRVASDQSSFTPA